MLAILVSVLLGGCRGGVKSTAVFADTLYMPRYATGFAVYGSGASSVVSVKNPWQGAEDVEMNLFLRREGEEPPVGFEGVVVDAPLKKVVCMSSSYVAFIDAIGKADAVKGVSGAQYIYNDGIRSAYARGDVRDVGYDSSINFEAITEMQPDLVMIYGIYGGNSGITGKLDELGIKYMYIGDYVEQSPLGKAEWLVAIGEMFDEREAAAALFGSVEKSYNETCGQVGNYVTLLSSGKPRVMLNAPYRDTWFVPGDRSYMVRLITDAGGEYICAGTDSEKSRPISGESAYVFASRSDVWLNPGQVHTKSELTAENPRFAEIPPVRNNRVFNCNLRSTEGGGSDFWEYGAVRPDIVLKDIVKILYPGMLTEHELHYFRKVE